MRHIVRFTEIAPQFGRNTEDGKKIVGHARTTDAFGFRFAADARQIGITAPHHGQIGETTLSSAPVEIIWQTNRPGIENIWALANKHEAIRLRRRQGPQKDGVDDAENRGVRADSERESDNCDKSESGVLE